METGDPRDPRTLPLEPQGPARSEVRNELLAQTGGVLVGAAVNEAFRTWLVGPHGNLTLVVWPRGFSARFDELRFELLDEQGHTIANSGEHITIGGGFLVKEDDPRRLGHERVFITSARHVARAPAA